MRGSRTTYNCDYCGKEQTMRTSQYDKQKHHFCNRDCHAKNKITSIIHNCDYCGKEYTMKKSVYEKYKSHCCSPECRVNLSKNKITYNCDFCDKEYTVVNAQFNRSEKHFCGIDCMSKYFTGKNGQNYQGGYGKYCYKFNQQCRKTNREKFNNQCFICGLLEEDNILSTGKQIALSVHHIDSDKEQGCNDKNWLLVPLCAHCHSKVHGKNIGEHFEQLLSTMLYYKEMFNEYECKIDYRSL